MVPWVENAGRFDFHLERLQGALETSMAGSPGHRLVRVVHRPTGVTVNDDKGPRRLLVFHRVLVLAGANGMGALKPARHPVSVNPPVISLEWEPGGTFDAAVETEVRFAEPNAIDCLIRVIGHRYHPEFELLLSNSFAPGFAPGAFVDFRHRDRRPRGDFDVFRPGHNRRRPVCFFSNGTVDALLMGRPDDTLTVGVSYAGDETFAKATDQRALNLSLRGCDLHPGEYLQARVRLVINDFAGDASKHMQAYETFLNEAATFPAPLPYFTSGSSSLAHPTRSRTTRETAAFGGSFLEATNHSNSEGL